MKKTVCDYEDVICAIEKYYPKGFCYEDIQYKESVEYIRFKKLLENGKLRAEKDKFFRKAIKSVFEEYYVQNHIHTPPYPSLHYSVLLKKDQDIMDDDIELIKILGGERYDLEIFISLIFPCCYFYTNKTTYIPQNNLPREQWSFSTHSANYKLDDKSVIALQETFEKNNIYVLSPEIIHKKVPNISTELLSSEELQVEIFHCLFSDIVTDYY
ncbi:MAG: hypothetical protein HFJ06_08680 [Lachnospiraceae bacterium]|nr:hypothetical protein [Lachnospiraceae bacterium]